MASLNTSKVDGNTVSASEWNQLAEINNLVSNTGQTPSNGNLQQIGIASARYSSAGQHFEDSSASANTYILSPVSPFRSPVSSTAGEGYFIGMRITFKTANANSGASTVNVNSLGAKSLKKSDGTTDVTTGDIPAGQYVTFIYNGTHFVKQNQTPATSTAQGIAFLPLPIDPITAGNNSATPNTDVDFFAGTMTLNDNSAQVKATAMTKRLQSTGSWTAGNNGNGLLSGAKANSSTYHWFALYKASDNSVDYGCILGVAGTTPDPTSVLPSGYSKYQYIFSVLTDGSGNIRRGSYSFRLDGSYTCEYNTYIENRAYSASPLTATLLSLSVPLGLKLIAKTIVYGVYSGGSTRIHLILIDPAKTTTVATSGNFNFSGYQSSTSNAHSSSIETLTDTSGRVSLMSTSGSDSQVITTGFIYNPINR